jgi:hypothetical protein
MSNLGRCLYLSAFLSKLPTVALDESPAQLLKEVRMKAILAAWIVRDRGDGAAPADPDVNPAVFAALRP